MSEQTARSGRTINGMSACHAFSDAIAVHFRDADRDRTTSAIARGEFDAFADRLPEELLKHLAGCDDCPNDILWYLTIRGWVDVADFACLHLAYASSEHAGRAITHDRGLYTLSTGPGTGIVIGFCPWCARELPVSG